MELKGKIGNGLFSTVYTVIKDNNIVIKIIKSNSFKYLDVVVELLILNNFKSNNIINSHGITFVDNKLGIVLDLANGGTLDDYLFSNDLERELAIKNISDGIKWLHSNRWLHLDLKPDNILIRNGNFFISDFSLSRRTFDLTTKISNHSISPLYRPYENLKGSNIYSDKSDLWSLGLLIYGIINGRFIEDEVININISKHFNINMSIIIHIEKLIAWKLWPPNIDNSIIWDKYKNYLNIDSSKRESLAKINVNYNIFHDEIDDLKILVKNKYPEIDDSDLYNFCYSIISSIYGNIIFNKYTDRTIEILNSINFKIN
jgi:serine/threonine protein kinase